MAFLHLFKPQLLSWNWGDTDYLKNFFQNILNEGDIRIQGHRPWDLQVHQSLFYRRVAIQGSRGLGEAYMDGWWDVQCLDDFFYRIFQYRISEKYYALHSSFLETVSRFANFQTKKRSLLVAQKHYDLGNSFYQNMLDSKMIYSCAYWKKASTLEEAQEQKLRLICEKLYLQPGMTLLDIGCGWGGLAKFAAEHYGVSVVGVTNSQQQYEFARDVCKNLPIEIQRKDYREVEGVYDRVVSVGMFEHVGFHNYSLFMNIVHRALKGSGLFLLHTIGNNISHWSTDEWLHTYIFPHSQLPSARQIAEASEGLFVMEDWHNFGADYDKTLMAWYQNFKNNWPRLSSHYGERLYRMWT